MDPPLASAGNIALRRVPAPSAREVSFVLTPDRVVSTQESRERGATEAVAGAGAAAREAGMGGSLIAAVAAILDPEVVASTLGDGGVLRGAITPHPPPWAGPGWSVGCCCSPRSSSPC